ncbi:cupin domain-containing protein [Parapedobacter indicus]|uniref:Cupin domain protein n=1 Tax=Parapedobacter indicus TaxID=1477437 RepID=A0A1I3KB59_9SPHI|nr:cupin domain-containing protein [Parapedobacter indicus]PPL01767.1 quercetin dioxygenase-like cupin family protein [Parapedobacter indicus]SFI69719.1 Cupin domain protein [Parapedobacter indicus]
MPTKGQIITNPATGDSYEFLETAKDTNGVAVTMRATIKSKGPLVPNHRHVFQDETFEIISGQLTIFKDGKSTTFAAGEKIAFPKNTPHNHYNNSEEELVYIHSVKPALDFDYLIENLVGLAADGKSKNGKFGLVQELVTLKYLESKTYLADIPIGVQKFLMHTVAPIGRMFGYRAIYKKYSGIEK